MSLRKRTGAFLHIVTSVFLNHVYSLRQFFKQSKGSATMGIMDSFNDSEGQINLNTGKYRVLQVVLREKFIGKGSKNYDEIEKICNDQFANGYKLHTFAQSTAQSSGFGGGDRTVCNLVFERIN